ncbi:VOC family protein [Novosphingobium sp.]|uniref:VOC family protein n=1 Tax=Novosphingobium sp. TaxID=1874826 RepID=UPI002633E7E6|nr:VOC family protein [Novosphingobium sp.]
MAGDGNPVFAVKAFDHLVLRARDPGVLVAFYRDAIGCAVEWERPELGLTHLRAGSAMIDVVDINGPLGTAGVAQPAPYGRNVDHLCLRIDPFDFDALSAHFAKFGMAVEPPKDRFGATGFGQSIYLADPEGNGIELKAEDSRPKA